MKFWVSIFFLSFFPAAIFSQNNKDTGADHHLADRHEQALSFMFNAGTSFYTAKDMRINEFMNKYGYRPPQNFPIALYLETAVLPSRSKMAYGINAKIIVSDQDLITADFSLGAYRRFFETKHLWFMGGLSMGEHFDRIVLNKGLPPLFDSIAAQYGRTLSLHRTGFIAEPAAKVFWYPLQTKGFQLGLFAATAYDLDFNSRWKLGYYPQNSDRFKRLKKPTGINTKQEFGWVLSGGISIGF